MTSPTQGPWTYHRFGAIRSRKHILARMPPDLYHTEGMTEAEIDANGYLMAAAWDLRAAAVDTIASSHKLQDGKHDTPEGFVLIDENALRALMDALAKAENRK